MVVSMNPPLARGALRRDLLATESSAEAKHNRLLVKLNFIEMENEQFKKLILKCHAAMTEISTYLEAIEKNIATSGTEKWFLP